MELFSEMFLRPEEQMIVHTAHLIICPGGVHVVTCCNWLSLCSTPGGNTISAAEQTCALICAVAR